MMPFKIHFSLQHGIRCLQSILSSVFFELRDNFGVCCFFFFFFPGVFPKQQICFTVYLLLFLVRTLGM